MSKQKVPNNPERLAKGLRNLSKSARTISDAIDEFKDTELAEEDVAAFAELREHIAEFKRKLTRYRHNELPLNDSTFKTLNGEMDRIIKTFDSLMPDTSESGDESEDEEENTGSE
jgi:hypothetical protein